MKRRIWTGALLVLACSMAACESHSPTQPGEATPGAPVRTWSPDSVGVQQLTRALSIALADEGIRARLLADMHDSPDERHRLDLGSYLRSAEGAGLLSAVTAAGTWTSESVLLVVGPERTGLELIMPRYTDRRAWRGDANLAVVGTHRAPGALMQRVSSVPGFAVGGRGESVALGAEGRTPYLGITPNTQPFTLGPAGRSVARSGGTGLSISGDDELRRPVPGTNRMVICDPSDGCAGGGGITTMTGGSLDLPSRQTFADCTTTGNALEPVNATCRQELIWAFRPRLIFNSDEPCKTREPRATVARTGTAGEIAIFYAASYWQDCSNRSNSADSHWGDSEFIIVRVGTLTQTILNYYPTQWYLKNVTLSAHYGAGFWDSSWTGDGSALEFRQGEYLMRPKIYVSWGKHGNYRDTGSCARGANYFDDCSQSVDTNEEFGFQSGATADLAFRGYHTAAQDCFASSAYWLPGTECYWSYSPNGAFSGWLNASPNASAYTQLLAGEGF